MKTADQQALREFLEQFVTPERQQLMDQVLKNRTRHLTLVLEHIDKPHNASAVLRTAECFGIQDLHVVEREGGYRVNPGVAMGAGKWVDLHKYGQSEANNTEAAYAALRAQGYGIYATSPAAPTEGYDHVDISRPVAVVFGTELTGITEYAREQADGLIRLPMYGFTESYNLSVSAALVMDNLLRRMREREGLSWKLDAEQIESLRLDWYRKSIRSSEALEAKFWKDRAHS